MVCLSSVGCSSPNCHVWSPNTPATTTSDTQRTPYNSPNSSPLSPPPTPANTTTVQPVLCRHLSKRAVGREAPAASSLTSAAVAADWSRKVAPPLKDSSKMLYKTTLCPWHARGRCFAAESCNYAHSEQEKRDKPNLRETRLCQTFMRRGRCDISECSFAHGYEKLRSTVGVDEGRKSRVFEGRGGNGSSRTRQGTSKSTRGAGGGQKASCGLSKDSENLGGGRRNAVRRVVATHLRAAPSSASSSVWDQWVRAIARKEGVHNSAELMESVRLKQMLEDKRVSSTQEKQQPTRGDAAAGASKGCPGSPVGLSRPPRFISFFKFFSFDEISKASPTVYYD
eukprot:GHVS01094626.1.p1 GENE.GHVS01094626.1~~GHVS01094626.1.p1  ORF type:complete len:339 (+),score=46.43 GHVS01094626.1:993-2009(+)